jgi:flagellin-like hook-associated protein FlgL
MIINHNIPAINAQRNVSQNTYKTGKIQEKPTSGQRLNRAADDAALSNTGEITTISNSQVSSENIQSAESRIRDADTAREMMELTRLNILTHASTAVMAQSNTQPQNILKLLG